VSFSLKRLDEGGITRLEVSGEVDVSCADELRDALEECLAEGPTSLEVGLSGTSYIDSTGIGVVVGAAVHASEANASFAVVAPQRNVARVLTLLGVDERLGVRP
jgi:anti-sigma B factor antagonist